MADFLKSQFPLSWIPEKKTDCLHKEETINKKILTDIKCLSGLIISEAW